MKFVLRCGPPAIERALLEALVGHHHEVTLLGDPEAKRAVADRWPTGVKVAEAGPAAAQAVRDADVAIVVDDAVALRPAPRKGSGEPFPSRAGSEELEARRGVWVIPPGATISSGSRWLTLHVDAVYGAARPEEDLVSALLALVRSVPVVPVFADSDLPMAPLFAPDLARVVVALVERDADHHRSGALSVRGGEVVTLAELGKRLADLGGKKPLRVPLPRLLAGAGSAFLQLFGMEAPVPDAGTLERARARGASAAWDKDDGGGAGLATELGVSLTPLDEALPLLATTLPEQLPASGYGAVSHKRFWIDITGSSFDPEALLEVFRRDCRDILPITFDVEAGTPDSEVIAGHTLTAALPLRGNIQMRVQETLPRRITFATIEGHPIAGIVRFMTDSDGASVRFIVEVFARSSTPLDFVALHAGGSVAQNLTWRRVCERMLDRSGGTSPRGHQESMTSLSDADAEPVIAAIESLVAQRERDEHTRAIS